MITTKNAIAALFMILIFAACSKDNEADVTHNETLVLETGSTAKWKGYLETGYFNSGTILLDAEDFVLKGDKIIGGDISIPVSSILITNELPADKKLELLHHLQSTDFFSMVTHPYVVYSFSSAEKTGSIDAKGNNYLIKGNLTLLGKSFPLDVPAKINISETEVMIVSNFTFDRTKWGMLFASGNDLPADGKIKNDIEIDLDLKATRF